MLNELTLTELLTRLDSGEASAEQATADVLAAIEDAGPLNAFISVEDSDALLDQARLADQTRASGDDHGPLTGVPIALKDNLCTKGTRTTAGSAILHEFTSPYDATVVRKLRDAGAIIVGKTNLDEFAMGSSNETSFFGPVHNPHDRERVPGGSSGGSAAAVAAHLCTAALGSDTGGSIRQPASHCGVVGLKPTYGRISRFGLIAFASSLDQIGPITKSVEDAALLLEVLAGADPNDMTSADRPVPSYAESLNQGVEGLTLGVPKEYFSDDVHGLDPAVRARVHETIEALEEAGARTVEVSLPHTEYAVATYYLIATAEASSNLARYDGVRYTRRAEAQDLTELYEQTRAEGFGPEVKRRIMLGTYVLSAGFYEAYYRKAQQVRTLIRRDFDSAFEEVDAIITPTTPTPAFRLGEKTDDPLQMYLEDIYTIPCNLAGLPGLSVPCGSTDDGLPIGLQIMAPAFREEMLFRIGSAVSSR